MPVNVGEISVSVTANTAPFTAEMNRAEQQAAKSGAGIQTSLDKLNAGAAGIQGTTSSLLNLREALQRLQTGSPALEKVGAGLEGLKTSAENAASGIASATGTITHGFLKAAEAVEAFFAVKDVLGYLTGSLVRSRVEFQAHSAVMTAWANTATNAYRAIRLLTSPTVLTVGTLAAGAVVEELGKNTYRRGRELEQESLIAARNNVKISPAALSAIDLSANSPKDRSSYLGLYNRAVSNADGVKDALGVANDRSPAAYLRDIAAALSQIKDPYEQAAAAQKAFGEQGAQALALLDKHFVENADRVHDWGLVLSEEARRNILQFKSDIDSLGHPFDNLGATIHDALERAKIDLASFFAYIYAHARDGSFANAVLAPFHLDQTINTILPSSVRNASSPFFSAARAVFSGAPLIGNDDAQLDRERERNFRSNPRLKQRTSSDAYPDQLIPDELIDLNALNQGTGKIEGIREKLQRLQQEKSKVFATYFQVGPSGDIEFKDDLSNIQQASGRVALSGVSRSIAESNRQLEEAEQAKKASLEKTAGAAEALRQRQGRINELLAEARASAINRDAAGNSGSESAYAKAASQTEKVVTALNSELSKHGQRLTLAETLYIRAIENTTALNSAEAEWKSTLASTDASLRQRAQGQLLLNAAIGQGADALRRASIESQLLQNLGTKADDRTFLRDHADDIANLRSRLGADYDARKAGESATNVDNLKTEIEAVERLTAAQAAGAVAVRQAALEAKLVEMRTNGATPAELAATQRKDAADRANKSAAKLAQLNQEIEATRRLTAAQLGGLESVRQAELQNRLVQMQREGATPAELNSAKQADQSQYDLGVAGEAGRRLNGASEQIGVLQQQLAIFKEMRAVRGSSLQLENAIKSVTQELRALQNEQLLFTGTAADGLRVFYRELVTEGASAAQQFHSVLVSAFEGVNDNLAKLITGQKASWGSFFTGLGEQTSKIALTNLERGVAGKLGGLFGGKSADNEPWSEQIPGGGGGVLGSIGGLFGFGGGGGKRDGSSAGSALYVQMIPAGGPSGDLLGGLLGGGQSGSEEKAGAGEHIGRSFGFLSKLFGKSSSAAGGLLRGLFGGGGGLGSLLGKLPFGGFFAEGGNVDPGHAYVVGEKGPEIWTPPSSGNIVPNNKLGGSSHYYTIDARGTDPVLTEQRTRAAIIAAHNSAVTTSAKVSQEQLKRRPQK